MISELGAACEIGDWEMNGDGVAGGIGTFKDADKPNYWMKYQTAW
jgi:hypothetical protein